MATVGARATGEHVPAPTAAEREVADLLPIGLEPRRAIEVRDAVPLWFHTFNLDGRSLYTPGIARDHRYRIPSFPRDLTGRRVLDVGAFDGFYSFLAEARGAERVLAIDNEQYIEWVRARFGLDLGGAEGLRTIAWALGSDVEYMPLDAYDLDAISDRFDLIICFGMIHRVRDPLGLLEVLRRRLEPGGSLLLETHGVTEPPLESAAGIRVCEPGELYARDEYVFWGFSGSGLDRLARLAGFEGTEVHARPIVDGRPRIICTAGG